LMMRSPLVIGPWRRCVDGRQVPCPNAGLFSFLPRRLAPDSAEQAHVSVRQRNRRKDFAELGVICVRWPACIRLALRQRISDRDRRSADGSIIFVFYPDTHRLCGDLSLAGGDPRVVPNDDRDQGPRRRLRRRITPAERKGKAHWRECQTRRFS